MPKHCDLTFVERRETTWAATMFSPMVLADLWHGKLGKKDLRQPTPYEHISRDLEGRFWIMCPCKGTRHEIHTDNWILIGNETGEIRVERTWASLNDKYDALS